MRFGYNYSQVYTCQIMGKHYRNLRSPVALTLYTQCQSVLYIVISTRSSNPSFDHMGTLETRSVHRSCHVNRIYQSTYAENLSLTCLSYSLTRAPMKITLLARIQSLSIELINHNTLFFPSNQFQTSIFYGYSPTQPPFRNHDLNAEENRRQCW